MRRPSANRSPKPLSRPVSDSSSLDKVEAAEAAGDFFRFSRLGPSIRHEMPDKMPARRTLLGDVAQWLEHLLCTQGVVGSSPIVSTTKAQFRGHPADSEVEA